MVKKYKIHIDIPGCPKGRIFKEDVNGDYFHSMTDDEYLSGKYQSYNIKKEFVINNKMFVEIKDKLNGNN